MARTPRNPFAPPRTSRPKNSRPFGLADYKAPKEPKPRNEATEGTLCLAIREKRLVSFRYRNTDAMERIVAPHVVWITESEGACLFGVQLRSETGTAESSPQHFDPYKLIGLRVLDETFTVDHTFKRDRYNNIICIVPR